MRILERELISTIERGTKVSMRLQNALATGYLIGMDEHDFLLACTQDGSGDYLEILDPPIMLIVNRRACSAVRIHTEDSIEDEPDSVQEFLTDERDVFARHYVPEQAKALPSS